jgi:hypothetical protein
MFLYVDEIIKELLDVCDGVTASLDIPSVFHGEWMRDSFTKVTDDILYIFTDAPFSLDDADLPNWLAWLEDLKLRCQEIFDQDIIWMTLQRVERISADDYNRVYRRRRQRP